MKLKLRKVFFVVLSASLLLAACAKPTPVPASPALPKIDPVAILAQARTYYNGGVNRETNVPIGLFSATREYLEIFCAHFNAKFG